jgi:hypothetical protein
MGWLDPEKAKEYHKQYRERNREKRRAYQKEYDRRTNYRYDAKRHRERTLRKKYGISLDEFNAMVVLQGNLCAICKQPPGKFGLFVDHNHVTGKVRGLLCSPCNSGIGYLRGDSGVSVLEAATAYLRERDV